ncbi:MAG: Oxidoreductase FAD/NAD(P)-binding domain protein [Parcubacteria group bacterium GW2011_GWB1_45_10]|nr:MAG: Oxidoreductase FAD/NAD(P)-binding domain protein [Parcubacteria group bacterium GW2011_GWB1_45_10]
MIIEGPFGVFTDNEKVSDKILLIAGGIGITPLRSLAQAMVQKGKDVILLFGNKTRQDIVFENEFKDITGLKLINVLSDEKNYSGETGYIDKEKIQRLVPDFLEREVFLCGPEPMMDSVISDLKELDFPSAKLHFEKFSL